LAKTVNRMTWTSDRIGAQKSKKTAISKQANVPPDAHALPAITSSETLEARSPSPGPRVYDMG
jgi:hypothetical protein